MSEQRPLPSVFALLHRYYDMRYALFGKRRLMIVVVWGTKRKKPLPEEQPHDVQDQLLCHCWHRGQEHNTVHTVHYECNVPSCSCTQFDTRPKYVKS